MQYLTLSSHVSVTRLEGQAYDDVWYLVVVEVTLNYLGSAAIHTTQCSLRLSLALFGILSCKVHRTLSLRVAQDSVSDISS